GEQNGVDAVDHMAGVQRVELAGSGGTATDRAGGAHPTVRSEYHAATRGPLEVGPMPYRNTSDGGETGGSAGRHGSAKNSSACTGCGGHIRKGHAQPRPAKPPDHRAPGGRRQRHHRRTAIECLTRGAYDYLSKPVDLDELEMSLQSGLRQRQLEIDRRELEQWLAREVAVRTRDLEERTTVVEDVALTALAAAGDWPG